jgi:endonuclease/exonuclease/phosphatase (EEP) superfamily protein YafD
LTRILVLIPAALVALPCVLVSGSRLLRVARSPVPQLAAFVPWAVLGWVLVLALLLSAHWWWLAAVVLVLLAAQTAWVLPTRAAAAATVRRPGAIPVKVMTINAWVGGADATEILRLARDNAVDLLAVEEALPELVSRLNAGLGEALPQVVQSDPNSPTGTVVWSRWPLSRLGPSIGAGEQIARMLLRVPGAVPVRVVAVHTMSPGRGRIDGWDRDLQALIRESVEAVETTLMLGDFNATRDHKPFRDLLATGLVDAAEAVRTPPWRGATWPANKRLLPVAVRLDHVLVTPSAIAVRAVRVFQVSGTDHHGVLAELELRPHTA